jgi:ATP-binding cassette, subfamily B, bacterial CvaB/MchF/RaxB
VDAGAALQYHWKDGALMAWTDAIRTHWGAKLPVVLQTEAAECGLACLAMVLGWHGVVTDLAVLRQRHAVSLKGMHLADISRLAQKENLGTRAVRLELAQLGQLKLPAILHWELNHFVVLKSVGGQHIVIHDPGFGMRKMSMAEVSQKFTGVAMELWPEPGFKPRKEATRIALSQLIGSVKGFLPSLTQVLILSLVLEVLGLASPLLMQWIIDHVVVARDGNLLTTLAIGFGLLLGLQQIFGVARAWTMMSINTAINVQWQSSIFTHLLRLPIEYFQKRHLGDIVSRTGSINEIQRVLTSAFVEALFDGAMMALTLVMMFIYSPMLAWISIVAVLLYLMVRVLWFRPMYLASQEYIVRGALLSSHYLETIRGVRAIKLFSRQPERQAAWQTLLVAQTNANLQIQKIDLFYRIVRALLSGSFNIALLWVGTRQILDNTLSVGMLMAFLAYRAQFDTRMSDLIAKFFDLKMLSLHAERLADVVLTSPEPLAPLLTSANSAALGKDQAISLQNIKFRYADQDPWVLDGVTAQIEPGQSVAIVGGSGCGKTTLAALLLGVYQPQEGSLLVGGVPLERLGLAHWRSKIGTVMQDDTLFAGSVAENISFFDPQPDHDWMAQCAQSACLADDIEKMPMGYQTLVGDMGTVLSGGQKQRVLLARALYKRPRILLLDEATSHLDIQREAKVNAAIASLDMTRIIIAHRPETIGAAQRVLEIEDGKIVFDGVPADYFARMGVQRLGGSP